MNPEDRFAHIENTIEKHNDAIRDLIVVSRSCLESISGLNEKLDKQREIQQSDHERLMLEIHEMREAQSATGEKLNILVDTVDRIIRHRNS